MISREIYTMTMIKSISLIPFPLFDTHFKKKKNERNH